MKAELYDLPPHIIKVEQTSKFPTTSWLRITCVSGLTLRHNTMELFVTPDELQSWIDGELIQNAMPYLSAEEREFLISGSTPEEWDAAFGGEE